MDSEPDPPTSNWSSSIMSTQPGIISTIDTLSASEAVPGMINTPSAMSGYTTVQLTEGHIQQLTEQGVIQSMLPSSGGKEGLQHVYALHGTSQVTHILGMPVMMTSLPPGPHDQRVLTLPVSSTSSLPPPENLTSLQQLSQSENLVQTQHMSQSQNLPSLQHLPQSENLTSLQPAQLSHTNLSLPSTGTASSQELPETTSLQHSLFRVTDGALDETGILSQEQTVASLGFTLTEDIARTSKQLPDSYQPEHPMRASYQTHTQEASEMSFTPAPTSQLTVVPEQEAGHQTTRGTSHQPTFQLIGHMDRTIPPQMDSDTDESESEEEATDPTGTEADLARMLSGSNHISSLNNMSLVTDEQDEDVEIESHLPVPVKSEKKSLQQDQVAAQPVRKSERLAEISNHIAPVRPPYVSRPYSTQELWCEECQRSYTQCPDHKLQAIYDKVVLSRAWASLPKQLQIFRLSDSSGPGVFAKKPIPKQVQFGPFVAELVTKKQVSPNSKFVLMVDQEDSEPLYLDATDENKCNWMMFVRPATSYRDQNMVAYQLGTEIYFTTMKPIEPRQELKVWYAAHYAERLGVKTHDLSEEDLEALGEASLKWACYECGKKYATSAQLQNHLTVHEQAESEGSGGEHSAPDTPNKTTGRRVRRRRKPGRPPKKQTDGLAGGGEDTTTFQSWKKRKTNLYLNRMKKYREPMKRPIKSLYKRTGKDSGGNEWVCTHCGLTFDKPSLLNLHTLTHAAEDVSLADLHQMTATDENNPNPDPVTGEADGSCYITPLQDTVLLCPVCKQQFERKEDLIEHASVHATASRNPKKPYRCTKCWKSFSSLERLQRHMGCHGDDSDKPLQCVVCLKRFMNNPALACHMKTHSDQKYYVCPLCNEGFDQVHALRSHTASHAQDGMYQCPQCHKMYSNFPDIKKHMRLCHSHKEYPCPHCDKTLSRIDKLKLHLLKHSNHREFMCETCGRQFKRKDKLREHCKRLHTDEKQVKNSQPSQKTAPPKFVPRVAPTDYQRFIYKCHLCMLGFKRRGMLVNHMLKRHPTVKPDTVPELSLPILKTQREFFCQYCDKVYKSSTKRKLHILKNHPGSQLPASSRKASDEQLKTNFPNASFSHTVGSVTTMPHSCQLCSKQYASKAKLLQHLRKKHRDQLTNEAKLDVDKSKVLTALIPVSQCNLDPNEIPTVATVTLTGNQQITDSMQAADLLTQAMSELTQSLEFRQQQQDAGSGTVAVEGGQELVLTRDSPALQQTVTIHTVPPGTSLDLGQFGQQLLQYEVPSPPPLSSSPGTASVVGRHLNSQPHTITMVSNANLMPRTW